jgi:hypothetical protein
MPGCGQAFRIGDNGRNGISKHRHRQRRIACLDDGEGCLAAARTGVAGTTPAATRNANQGCRPGPL